jgi:hypothetical protein
VPASGTTDEWRPTSRQPAYFSTGANSATRPVADWHIQQTISSHPRPAIAERPGFAVLFCWRRHVHAGSSVVVCVSPLTARLAFFRSLNEDGRSAVADQLPATSMRAQSVRSAPALTPGTTSARRHALCIPHRIGQDIEPEVSLPVSTPRPGAAQRPARLF